MRKFAVQSAICILLACITGIAGRFGDRQVNAAMETLEAKLRQEYTVRDIETFGENTLESIKGIPASLIKINETMVYEAKYGEPIDEEFEGTKTTVHAAAGGTVRELGDNEDIGKYIIIQHGTESETTYGNLSSINCSLNERVKKGEIIGEYENNPEKNFFYTLNYFD